MTRKDTYNTKQKDVILSMIKEKKDDFTAKDIYNDLKGTIGLTTIYRFIDKLYNDGYLIKSLGKDNIAFYSFVEKCNNQNHFYLKCRKCGHLEHIDCDCIHELSEHIFKKHNFKSDEQGIMITALCSKCRDE